MFLELYLTRFALDRRWRQHVSIVWSRTTSRRCSTLARRILIYFSWPIKILCIAATIATRRLRLRRSWKHFIDRLLDLLARRRLIKRVSSQTMPQRHRRDSLHMIIRYSAPAFERRQRTRRAHDRQ